MCVDLVLEFMSSKSIYGRATDDGEVCEQNNFDVRRNQQRLVTDANTGEIKSAAGETLAVSTVTLAVTGIQLTTSY